MATNDSVNAGLSGVTGTGNFVGATSPTLTTPTLGVATATSIKFSGNNGLIDSNGNEILALSPTASAVNYFTLLNAATGGAPTLEAIGSDTNIGLTLKGQGTGAVNIHGTGTNDSASAGYVGEYISSQVTQGSAVSIADATFINITSISLTAGDWDIAANATFLTGTVFNNVASSISTVSATISDLSVASLLSTTGVIGNTGLALFRQRLSITSTTTVYLIGFATYSTGSPTACGFIGARRVR